MLHLMSLNKKSPSSVFRQGLAKCFRDKTQNYCKESTQTNKCYDIDV